MSERWHLNCDECGTCANGLGSEILELLHDIAQMHHDETGHVLSLWPHGNRDKTEKIGEQS